MNEISEKIFVGKEEGLLKALDRKFSNKKAKSINASNVSMFLETFENLYSFPMELQIRRLTVMFGECELFKLHDTNAVEYNAYSIVRDLLNFLNSSSTFLSRREVEEKIILKRV